VKDGNPWFIQFHASWCIHCKEAAEVWGDFEAKHGTEVNIAKVDCTAEDSKELCDQFLVRGFPSFKMLKGGKSYDYLE